MTPGERIAFLEAKVENLEAQRLKDRDELETQIREDRKNIESLRRFQAWLTGIGATAVVVSGALWETVKKRIGLD